MNCYLWFSFVRYISVHEIVALLGDSTSMALPAFHAFTGCDSTASFFGRGKKTAWQIWQAYPEVTSAFLYMSSPNPSKQHLQTLSPLIQGFVNRLYGVTGEASATVDSGRVHLLIHQGKPFQDMPPSSDALEQKILRTTYQVCNK